MANFQKLVRFLSIKNSLNEFTLGWTLLIEMNNRYNYENYKWIRDHLITLFCWEKITKKNSSFFLLLFTHVHLTLE